MKPTIGRIVVYKLTHANVQWASEQQSLLDESGVVLHRGNPIAPGDEVPLLVVRVWPDEFGEGIPGVNGQAFLDGDHSLWVTSAREGTDIGTWHWPERVEG